jgi:hypothetical protein
MAVFVASAFFGIVAFTTQVSAAIRVELRPASVFVEVPPADGAAVEPAVTAALAVPGAGPAAIVRQADVVDPAFPETVLATAWIVRCEELLPVADLPEATCGDADVHLVSELPDLPPATVVRGYALDADAEALGREPTVELALRPGLGVDRLVPGPPERAGVLPDLVIEPSAVEGGAGAIRPLFAMVATDGSRAVVERVRTGLEAAMPTGGPATGAEIAAATTRIVDELGRIVTLGVAMTMAVAGASLAIAVTGSLLDRRRPFALLRLSGVTLRTLRSILLVEAAGPLVAVALLSGLLGVAVSQLLLRLVGGGDVPLPDASFLLLLLAGVGGALVIVAGTLPLVGPMTDLEETRFE